MKNQDKFDLQEHLYKRHVRDYTDIRLDTDNNRVCFLMWSLAGQLTGILHYNPLSTKKKVNDFEVARYFMSRGGPNKDQTKVIFYGARTLTRPGALYIVEGVFDAITLHSLGYPAIACLSNNPKNLSTFFFSLSRPIIAVCDGDESGRELGKFGNKKIYLPKGTDLNDFSLQEAENLVLTG